MGGMLKSKKCERNIARGMDGGTKAGRAVEHETKRGIEGDRERGRERGKSEGRGRGRIQAEGGA